MKVLSVNLLLCLLLFCGPSVRTPNRKAESKAVPAALSPDAKIGITGCLLPNAELSDGITREEIRLQAAHYLADFIRTRTGRPVVDRTKLSALLQEHSLSLSGLVKTGKEETELNLSETDYLVSCVFTGFSAVVREVADDGNMGAAASMYQGRVKYRLNLELVDTKTGDVAWSWSGEAVNAEYDADPAEVDLKNVVFSSLKKTLSEAVDILADGLPEK